MKEESMKKVSDVLDSYAYKNGKDHIGNFNDWLAWMCNIFNIHSILEHGVEQVFNSAKEENPAFFEAMTYWIEIFNEGVIRNGAWDSFGTIYEACYQSRSKADALGQFFTPSTVSDLMAQIVGGNVPHNEDGIATYYDCACGSGRTLVSAWRKCDQYDKNFFYGGDLDGSSVNMCALNFMINGMVGVVERRNALTMEWYGGYIVNACKVPFVNNLCGLEYYNEESEFLKATHRLKSMMKYWNVGQYRPKDTAAEPQNTIEPPPVVSEITTEPQQTEKLQPFTQLTLF